MESAATENTPKIKRTRVNIVPFCINILLGVIIVHLYYFLHFR